ncbi:MAG: hypothetical protein H0V35_07115 [Nitrospira sp.]|nr:hypothetical protein [Nitrospira sp.]
MANRRGRIYLRGKTWWLQYSFNGRDVRESSGSTRRTDAEKILTRRLVGKDQGTLAETTLKRFHFSDLQAGIEAEYVLNRRASLDRVQDAFKALAGTFDGWLTTAMTDRHLLAYANGRLAAGMAHATVRYELAVFKRSFKLLKLPCPSFPSIQVDNARQGFFEKPDFERVVSALPDYLQPVMRFSYFTGWRTISEVLPLTWAQVDWQAGMVRLEPGTTKNKHGRMFPFRAFPGLADVLKTQWEAAQQLMVSQQRICPGCSFE